jgi:hypothetical protein
MELLEKFREKLLENLPQYEILGLQPNEAEKFLIVQVKAKGAIGGPIHDIHIIRVDFDQRIITFRIEFTKFQFYHDLIIRKDNVIPSVETIRGAHKKPGKSL